MRRTKPTIVFLAGMLLVALSGVAFADADEASIGGTLTLGYAEVGDPGVQPLWPIPLAGLGVRVTYAHLDWLAYEAGIEVEHTAIALDFSQNRADPDDIYPLLRRRLLWARAEVGATVRLGVQFIPTIYVGVGAQGHMVQTLYEIERERWREVILERDYAWLPIGVVGLGFDYRLDETWIAGFSLRAKHGATWDSDSFRSVTALFHLSYYWYPGNIDED